ncbi:TetR-like C-terminal domain-containing protein [Streptomyces sp.]|uniref:TetR-like C-terminal domain-containing protein n=1 Tax=Streptomyces sp. TaxID=1931 RepID=UPI002D78A55E|nr:TetR-like C-terminal domain-containing protein [Streptomyces sp.]HET6353410.1 TetR-like C-terminal domain-containing protein [Streptomyces sp.]
MTEELIPPDHGDIALDLRAHLRQLACFLGQSDSGAVFKALIAQAQHDPAFAEDFRARYLDEQRRRDRLPLERAVRRGQLPSDLDLAAETDQLVGPLYYRVLVTDEPVGQDFTIAWSTSFSAAHSDNTLSRRCGRPRRCRAVGDPFPLGGHPLN